MGEGIPLAPRTTLGVGGPATRFVECVGEDELAAVLTDADERGEPVLILGSGSNVVISDEGWPGLVVRPMLLGVDADRDLGRVQVRVGAGEDWDAFVARAVAEGWRGVECLSGIPGLVGATPIQNVGAYGVEVESTIVQVRVYDRLMRKLRTISAEDCGFSYRKSRFRRDARYVITEVVFGLDHDRDSVPLTYAELLRILDTTSGETRPLHVVREAVLRLRRAKGMVLDPDDADTRSVGSFFKNPIVTPEQVRRITEAADVMPPQFPAPSGGIKLPAAWLIEHAGVSKGERFGAAAVSSKHALAITNPGSARAADVLGLAASIRNRVRTKFDVTLEPEPVLVNCVIPEIGV